MVTQGCRLGAPGRTWERCPACEGCQYAMRSVGGWPADWQLVPAFCAGRIHATRLSPISARLPPSNITKS